MTSTQNPKLFKINKRPKDSLSDDEDDHVPSLGDKEFKYEYDQESESEPKCSDSLSIFLWLEYPGGEHYIGCFGQQSYTYSYPNDLIVAYNYNDMDKHWFMWLLNVKKLSPLQFIWIQKDKYPRATHLKDDEYILKQLSMIIEQKLAQNPSLQINLKTFLMNQPTKEYIDIIKSNISLSNQAINLDNIITYCASAEWAEKFANKSCLHRFIDSLDTESLFEKCGVYDPDDAEGYGLGLRECRGYVCKNKEEILAAFDKLTQELGHNNVVIKDCFGVGGDDITFWNSREQIRDKFVWKDEFKYMEMEEDLRHSKDEIEKMEWVGISFYENEVIGGGHEQIIINDAEFAGSKKYCNKEIDTKLKRITQRVMTKIGTKFMGGFDFGVQIFKDKSIEPKIYLVDMNTARYTATIQTFIVIRKYGLEDQYFIRKTIMIKQDANFKSIMEENGDVLFDEDTKCGAYYHLFHPAEGWSVVSIFGNDEKDANERLQRLQNITNQPQ